jgi:hypothetical protein
MPRTITQTLYKLEELSAESKATALECLREVVRDIGEDKEQIKEAFKERLKEYGFGDMEVYWSLSNCQGDGVAFYNEHISRTELKRIWIRKLSWHFPADIRRAVYKWWPRIISDEIGVLTSIEINSLGRRYSHYETMTANLQFEAGVASNTEEYHELRTLQTEVESVFRDKIKEISKELECLGYAMIEDMYSDTTMAEHAEANEFEFYADGRIYHG